MSRRGNFKTNGWDALIEIGIASINRGQIMIFILGLIMLFLVWRIPTEDIKPIIVLILNALKTYHILGWIGFSAGSTGWFVHSRYLRQLHTKEMKRVGDEKSSFQRGASSTGLGSSK